MEYTFKNSGINNLKVLFLFQRLLYNLLEKKNRKWGSPDKFSFRRAKFTPTPPILMIFQYKTLWRVLLKNLALTISFLFLFHRLLYNLLEKK